VIVEKTEFEPFAPLSTKAGGFPVPGDPAAPPPPTVTGYVVTLTGKAETHAPKGEPQE
jgi:hypothetical protein